MGHRSGRRGGIRTPDGLLPKQVHYQAVLRAENKLAGMGWVEQPIARLTVAGSTIELHANKISPIFG